MVYAPNRYCISRASTSYGGRTPSTKKSLNGGAQDGAVTTTRKVVATGACAIGSLYLDLDAYCIIVSIPELTTAAPGPQSAAPGVVGSEEAVVPGVIDCTFRSAIFIDFSAFGA